MTEANLNSTESGATVDTLVALLARQQSIVAKLDELGAGQASLIEHGRSDALLGLLQQRQNLIDQFAAAQREFQNGRTLLDGELQRADASTRENIRRLVDEISRGIEAVLQRDEKDQRSLQERRGQVRSELHRMDGAQSARSAYRSQQFVANRFADTQG